MTDPQTVSNIAVEHGGRFLEFFGSIAAAVFTLFKAFNAKMDKIVELLTKLADAKKE